MDETEYTAEVAIHVTIEGTIARKRKTGKRKYCVKKTDG